MEGRKKVPITKCVLEKGNMYLLFNESIVILKSMQLQIGLECLENYCMQNIDYIYYFIQVQSHFTGGIERSLIIEGKGRRKADLIPALCTKAPVCQRVRVREMLRRE